MPSARPAVAPVTVSTLVFMYKWPAAVSARDDAASDGCGAALLAARLLYVAGAEVGAAAQLAAARGAVAGCGAGALLDAAVAAGERAQPLVAALLAHPRGV